MESESVISSLQVFNIPPLPRIHTSAQWLPYTKNTYAQLMCCYFTWEIFFFFFFLSPLNFSVGFLLSNSSYAFPSPFTVGWAFQALSALFKFLTSWRGETKRPKGRVPHLKSKGIFPMKRCAVTWKSLCLLCLPTLLAPFNQILNALHALYIFFFAVRNGRPRISMPRWFRLCVRVCVHAPLSPLSVLQIACWWSSWRGVAYLSSPASRNNKMGILLKLISGYASPPHHVPHMLPVTEM